MCGIAGTTGLTRYTKVMLPYLAYDIEDRGTDSWSIFNNSHITKRLGKISAEYHIPKEIVMGDPVMIHTRNASTGKVTLENQHPFVEVAEDKSRMLVGMHNGCIHNHTELAEKYKWKEQYEVDTHILYKMLANDKSPSEIRGWGNCVWFEWEAKDDKFHRKDYIIKFVRFNADNLEVAKLEDGTMVFCSLKDSIEKAARFARIKIDKFYKLSGDNLYTYTPGDDEVRDHGRFTFGGRASYGRSDSRADGTWRHRQGGWTAGDDDWYYRGHGYTSGGGSASTGNTYSYTAPADHPSNDTTYMLEKAGYRGREQKRCGMCKKSGGADRTTNFFCADCAELVIDDILNVDEPSTKPTSIDLNEVYGISVFGAWVKEWLGDHQRTMSMNWEGSVDVHGREFLSRKEDTGEVSTGADATGTEGDVKALTVVPRADEGAVGNTANTSQSNIQCWGQVGCPGKDGEHNGYVDSNSGNAVEVHSDATEGVCYPC